MDHPGAKVYLDKRSARVSFLELELHAHDSFVQLWQYAALAALIPHFDNHFLPI